MTRVLALAGGVGGAKLAAGLATILSADELAICVNTGDDFDHLGLRICPDLDTVLYTLAGVANPETGWGRQNETWRVMDALAEIGGPTWFRLGDRDLSMHLLRTHSLRAGIPLDRIIEDLARRLGARHQVLPMSNDPVATMVETPAGLLEFQEYFVARRCEPEVRGFVFRGAERASCHPAILSALGSGNLQAVVICPSNPFVSIGPILALQDLSDALASRTAPVIAVSPLIGGRAVKGPAAKMFAELGFDTSSYSLAKWYGDRIDGLIIDNADQAEAERIESLGVAVHVTSILMTTPSDRARVAREALEFSRTVNVRSARPGASA